VETPILRKYGRQRNTKIQMEYEVWIQPPGRPRWNRDIPLHEKFMIPGTDNQSVRSTKMEMANQEWPNLRYAACSKPASMH
jgi:hypothetical protein